MPDSTALALYKDYTASGAAALLDGLPATSPRTFETTWREFKSGYVKDSDFNRIWSEIIGAFANTEGGVVVWGIYANTVPGSKIDAAESVHYVDNVEEFTTRLKKAAKDMVSPPIKVDVQPVLLGDGSKRGFVVCYIPEGIDKPYESLQAGYPYWGRFDDRCERLGRSFVRQLFFPQYNPRIEVAIEPNRRADESFPSPGHPHWMLLRVTNIGAITLHDASISVNAPATTFHTYAPGNSFSVIRPKQVHLLALPPSLHPEMKHEIPLIAVSSHSAPPTTYAFTVYARDMAPKRASIHILPTTTSALTAECT